jgi:DegV family protein with EDD domain
VIRIVTDTTCDLPAAWLERYQIVRLPINIQFGLESFQEGVTITPETFYRRIEAEQRIPTTSQPSMGQFNEVYHNLIAAGHEILSIHVTSKLSGTWQAACLSARQLADQAQISVVDSWTSSIGLGFLVREAAQWVEAGLSRPEIVARLEARRSQIPVFIMLNDLRYARMSGRVGRLRETLVSLLNIKPIIGVEAGALIPIDRVRTQKKGWARMVELAETVLAGRPVHIGMVHALAQPEAEHLLGQLKARLNFQETVLLEVSLSLAVHFGPGAVGFAVYPAEPLAEMRRV